MNRRFRIIVQRHAAYPLGMRGVADGRGDTHGQALAGVRSATRFHIETFGDESVDAVLRAVAEHFGTPREQLLEILFG